MEKAREIDDNTTMVESMEKAREMDDNTTMVERSKTLKKNI